MSKQTIRAVTAPADTLCGIIQQALKDNAHAVSNILENAHDERVGHEKARLEQSLADTKARIRSCVETARETQQLLGEAMKSRLENETNRIRTAVDDLSDIRASVAETRAEVRRMLQANGWTR